MGQILEIREQIGAGNVNVVGNDVVEVEKNDAVQKAYTVADITYEDASVRFGGVEFISHVDVDNLSDVQLRAIMDDPKYQVVKRYGETP